MNKLTWWKNQIGFSGYALFITTFVICLMYTLIMGTWFIISIIGATIFAFLTTAFVIRLFPYDE